MKGFIIDSDTWIEYFHQRSGVGAHISQVPRNEIFASEVSIAELTYGALHSSNVEKHMKEPMKLATGTETGYILDAPTSCPSDYILLFITFTL